MDEETAIEAVNAALEVGDWAAVSHLTADLYGLAVQVGDTVLAELVQDLHWIANDALAHPLKVGVDRAMNEYDRQGVVRKWNSDEAHQRMAGLASWAAFSARWRARQGLPLLHPMDVQYLTPGDFCNGNGCPLSPEVQRRRFREYVSAAVQLGQIAPARAHGSRLAGGASAELGLERASGFVRWARGCAARSDYEYGRADIAPYAPDALLPARPYGVPVVSSRFAAQSSFWLDGAVVSGDEDAGDDSWIDGYR